MNIIYIIVNHLGNDGIKSLCKGLKSLSNLIKLVLSCDEMDDESLKLLSENINDIKHLRSLILSYNNFESGSMKILAKKLAQQEEIQLLDLRGNFIGENGFADLADKLKKVKSLKTLDLRENLIIHAIEEKFEKEMEYIPNLKLIEKNCGSLEDDNLIIRLMPKNDNDIHIQTLMTELGDKLYKKSILFAIGKNGSIYI